MKLINTFNTGIKTLIAIMFFSACSPIYVPNKINTPLISNKGEIQAGLNLGVSGFDPQLTYGLTDHIAIMANGSFANNEADSGSDNFHKHAFFEAGGGYYLNFMNIGRFEVYGGYGRGRVKGLYTIEDISYESRADSYFNRFFIQPGIGVSSSVFDFSFVTRCSFVDMHVLDPTLKSRYNGLRTFIEPAITGKLGYKYLKLTGQLGFSLPINEKDLYGYQPLLFSLGLQINIGRTIFE